MELESKGSESALLWNCSVLPVATAYKAPPPDQLSKWMMMMVDDGWKGMIMMMMDDDGKGW